MGNRQSEFEMFLDDLLGLLRVLPWWAGPIVSLIAWALFALLLPQIFIWFAGEPKTLSHGLLTGLANIPRILAPFVAGMVLLVWLVALVKNYFAADRLDRQTGIDSIRGLSWRELEELLAEAFKRQGYSVTETGPGADGGIDLILSKDGREIIVQAKQWKAWKVGVKVIREFFGVQVARQADDAIVVTSGRFTDEAKRFAEENHIELIDGTALQKLIAGVQKRQPVQEKAAIPKQILDNQETKPVQCPLCSSGMVKRVAQRGPTPGQSFWGCPKYPVCKGTRSMV